MSEWISVKQRLPEENQWVLCKTGDSLPYVKQYEKGIFYDGDTYCYSPVGKIDGVTHWMALPKPPEGKE